MHPSLSKRVLETGIVPTLDTGEWISNEIPYSPKEVNRVFPGRPMTISEGTWFRWKAGFSYLFTMETARMINPVKMEEVEKAINLAYALKSASSPDRFN